MQARAYPWSTLAKVTREDVAAAAALHQWESAFARVESVARSLAGLLDARVELLVGRVRSVPSPPAAEDGIGVLLCSTDAPEPARAVLVEIEAALGVALVARALRRAGPTVVELRTAGESLPGAIAAIIAATARRVHARRALRVLAAGPARALEKELTSAAGGLIEASLTFILNDEAFAARVLVPSAVARAAPAPTWTPGDVAALGDVPISLHVVAAVSRSTAGEVGLLRRGDGWVPGGWGLRLSPGGGLEGPVLLAAAGEERGVGALLGKDGRLVVRDVGGPLAWAPEPRRAERIFGAPREQRSKETEDGVGEGEIDGDALAEAVGEVPVVVRVEIGIAEMRAREWASLAPGDVVALGRKIGDAVTLRVGGITVARGELVDLDGEVAVRILGRTNDDGRSSGQERS